MRPPFNICICAALLLSLGFLTPRTSQAVSISIANAALAPNGTGEISVLVTGAGEAINLVGYEFRISPNAGTSSQLQFLEEAEGFLSDASYLFAGNSFAANDGTPSSVGTVSTSVLPSDTFIGGDSSDDFADVAVSNLKLLVKLAVKHSTGPADPSTTIGHEFSVSLVPLSGDSTEFANGNSNTGFVDSAFGGVAFESVAGTVSILVPEPSTFLIVTGCAAISLIASRRRRNAIH